VRGCFLCLFVTMMVSFSCGQSGMDYIMIDDFSVGTPTLVVVIPANPSFPIINTAFTTDATIIGGERDLELYVAEGAANGVLTSGVASGQFTCATPNGAAGYSLLQYDGRDGSINLNPTGLGGVDLTSGGLAYAFRAGIEADLRTNVTITVYSYETSSCKGQIAVSGNNAVNEYFLNFSSFSGSCDFSNVGAIQVDVEMEYNTDVLITSVTTYGVLPPSPSQTRTPTATQTVTPDSYSASRTPAPTPSQTRTPTATATPTPGPMGEQSTCCLYFSSDQQYESTFCQQLYYACPAVLGFYSVGNHTVSSCNNCFI